MGYNDMNYEGDKRRSSYVAFVAENTSAALTVKTKSLVQKILFDDQQRATGVEFLSTEKHKGSTHAAKWCCALAH